MLKVIRASAGSGKTYTLALEYISLLLGKKDDEGNLSLYRGRKRDYHRHILAVTFTNKATAEMKQRIVKELAVLAGMRDNGESSYLKELCGRFNASEYDVRKASKQALTELLFDYSNFNVSTIDSFFQIVLRTFAAEVDIPYDYDVELDDNYVLQVGIHEFLSKISSDCKLYSQALSWLSRYVSTQLREGDSWNPFKAANTGAKQAGSNSLFGLASVINKEIFRGVHGAMEKYFNDENGGNIDRFQILVEDYVDRSDSFLAEQIKSALTYIDGKENLKAYIKKTGCMASWLNGIRDSADKNRRYDIAAEKLKRLKGYTDTDSSNLKKTLPANIASQAAEFNGELAKMASEIYRAAVWKLLYKSIAKNVYQLGLLGYISQSVYNFRKENNMILLSDTNELLSDIINESDAPFIYERVGTKVNNYLIDEFQDTSAMQWQNIKPLLSHSLSCNHDNLIIGDEKQCIYRFRNSDPSLLRSEVQRNFRTETEGGKSRNWRSAPVVIKFNNTLFTLLSAKTDLADVYSNVVQLTNNKRQGGFVCINALKKDCEKGVHERVLELIADMLHRGYRQSDIAILVDRNVEGAGIINYILSHSTVNSGLPKLNVVSSDSLVLGNSPSVRLVVSHLRYLAVSMQLVGTDDEDKGKVSFGERLHRVLRTYESNINAHADWLPGYALSKSFEQCEADVAKADDELQNFLAHCTQSSSLVSVVEQIIHKVLGKEALSSENPFIQAFQDLVIDFSNRGCATIMSFVRWWDRVGCKLSITSPEGVDAINVMTIHKSKGLEFPCVIIPFATWDIGKTESTMWFKKEEVVESGIFSDANTELIPPLMPISRFQMISETPLAKPYKSQLAESVTDNMNKTYVAFTRAIDELHIFTDEPTESNSDADDKVHRLGYYLNSFVTSDLQQIAKKINSKYESDVALSEFYVSDDNEGAIIYKFGNAGQNDRQLPPDDRVHADKMPDYRVDCRQLASYKLPDVYVGEQRSLGIMYHNVLSRIHTYDDVERTLRYCAVRFIVEPAKIGEVGAVIREILQQSEEVCRWFAKGNKVYNERTILIGEERRRPDRVIVTPEGETIVIDYKFGEQHSDAYTAQVRRYMEYLEAAGMKNVSGRIWYPLEGKIVNV